jgi:hypothetical protein
MTTLDAIMEKRVPGKLGAIAANGNMILGEIMKDVVVSTGASGPFVGSLEELIKNIQTAVLPKTPCDCKPEYDANGQRIYKERAEGDPYPHYQTVVATYPTCAYVRCSDEDKVWKMPISVNEKTGEFGVGKAEEMVQQFVPLGSEDKIDGEITPS